MIVKDILQRTASWLRDKGLESPRLEAELLLAHVLEADRVRLYMEADRPLIDEELDAYREILKRRVKGEPVAYLTGRREFYGLEFKVTGDVLVPRPETELLVDRARELGGKRLLDLGTGSGCIAIACAKHIDAEFVATDVSAPALGVAEENAQTHGVADRIEFREGDLFEVLADGERFDVVVCNPPYVADGGADWNVAAHEPKAALYGGPDGLDVVRRVVAGASAWTDTLLVEIGEDQGDAARALGRAHFAAVDVRKVLAGNPRILECVEGVRQA